MGRKGTKWARTVLATTCALTIGASTVVAEEEAPADKVAPVTLSGDVGVVTKYVFRAQSALGNQGASVQGSLNLSPDALPQLTIGTWYSTIDGQNNDEIDFYGDFTQEFGDFSVSVGSVGYTFIDNGDASAVDIYGGAGYGPVSTTLYYTVMGDDFSAVLADDDIWWEISADAPEILGVTPGATLQMGAYGEGSDGAETEENDDFEPKAIVFHLSKDLMEFISVGIHYSVGLGETRDDGNINNEFWAGFFLSF